MSPPPRFEPRGQQDLAPSGQGERARANLAALETLRALEAEGRPATAEEQGVLARWSGWGALPLIFEPRPARAAYDDDAAHERAVNRWDALDDVREKVRALLSDSEWADARRNTLNAHYTNGDLVQAVWGAVRKLGFKGGQVLEPGSGSGNFIGLAPTLLRGVRMTGVEVERNTAAISRYLYPDAEIITSGLEEVPLADGGFDAVVGNVPYGRYKRFDKVHNPDLKLSIHDHFVLKSLYATRPGGIVALITSRYTLDAEDSSARERMYELGDLVGAVRLPARAHQAAAGTDVVTDVLFLRRRAEGEEPGDDTWLTSAKQVLPGRPEELAVNAYFGAHPEYVLGDLHAKLGQFGPEVTVTDRGEDSPAAELEAAAAAIAVEAEAAGLMAASATVAETQNARPTVIYGGTEGALGLDEVGNPTIVEDGRAVPLDVHPDQRDKLVQLIRLKGMTQALYEAEAATPEPGETPELARLRAELRVAYRDYRKSNPPLSKPRQPFIFTPKEAKERAEREGLAAVPEAWKQRTAYAWIDDDPDASFLFGLEEWDDKTNTATEQQVLLSRVLEPRRLPTRAKTAEDAIALAMEWDGGRLDMARVASLLGVDQEEAAAQCADAGLAFRDPAQSTDETVVWEPRHRYLAGNVRTKLAEARERAQSDPSFAANVAALDRVQPEDLAPSEIKAKIGAPWIPVEVYNEFLRHLGFEDASVLHAGGTIWEVRGANIGDLARNEWGTPARPTRELFTALLRQTDSTIRVTWTDREGRTYVDQDATDAAQEKARLIAEAFEDWVWADKDRADRLAKLYNEQFNNLVLSDYSDLPLTLPGLISDWEMRPHQNAAIRRIVNEPTAMLAHVVGAGKTATMAAGAMELRRTGLAKKPAFVVPNHMLKQWTREFRELYPNARILAISASDLSKKRRAKFMARIAGGEWDAVILTHEAFNRVPLRPETQRAYLDQEMESLRNQLDAAAAAGMDSRTVKQIENTLANAEANLQQQIESMSDEIGVFLEDTGIDYLFVDEAHEYKNLRTVSAIPGAAIEGSAKATKLHMVVSWLRDTTESDRVACFATGTWPANSVTEMYVLQRFLAPNMLNEMGLHAFDNWAATFGEVVSQLEPDPKGNGYKYKARFSRFFNVPELLAGYRTFADVQLAEDLNLPTPPVREFEGQRGERILIPPAPAQREFIKRLPHQPWVSKPGGVLKALGEGLRASLDLSLVDASDIMRELGEQGSAGSKELGSKLPYAAEKIVEIWQETKDTVYPVSKDDPTPQPLPGGLQLVFLDEGTPGSTAKHGADLYADLRDELVDRGMPRESIRFIHEANTDRKKEKLFADCRAGRVSVLVGSTAKMGTGTNIQDRAVALHHLSYPWRPADMAQRDGRIERRGNLNVPWVDGTADDVRILYYITERTFDEFRLTTLARKARFIGQIQRRDFNLREIEDIGSEAINLGMLSALASGDPAILQLAEATAERARLQGLARSWDRQQDARTEQLKDLDDFLGKAAAAVDGMRAALPQRRPTAGDNFAMTVDDATYRSRDEAANALGARMVALARDQSLRPGQRVPVGTLGGLDFHGEIAFDHAGRRQLRLRFAWGHVPPLGQRDDRAQWQATHVTQANGRGAIQSLENFLNRLPEDLDKLDKSLSAQRGRRDEIASNVRDKDNNPYRMHARSKEREERALGKLVVLNEKHAALVERAERVVGVNEEREAELNEELTTLGEEIAGLRQIIADEHAVQEQARALARGDVRADSETGTATLEEAAAAAEDNEPEAQAATDPADTAAPAPAAQGEAAATTAATPDNATNTGDGQADAQDDQAPVPAQPAEAAPEPPAPVSLTDPGVWEEAVQAYTDAALADPQIAQAAQANDVADFTVAMASWFRGFVAEQWDNVPVGELPAWVLAYRREGDDAVQARNSLHAEVAGPVYAQLRRPAQEGPEPPAAAATDDEAETPAEQEEQDAPADESTTETDDLITELQQASLRLDEWWETSSDEDVPEGYQPFSDSSVRLQPGDTVRAGWRQYMEDRHLHYHTVTVERGPDPTDGYYVGRNESGNIRRFHPRYIVAVPDGSRLLSGNAPALEETPAPAPTESEQETTAAEQTPLQGLIEGFGDRVSVGHIGAPQPARTGHPAGWAIMALLNEQQLKELASACAVDRQPVPSGAEPTERVREWIAEQRQNPTTAWYASSSLDLPEAVRGNGDVRLSSGADGITIEQSSETAGVIQWAELPAWIEAAVAYDEDNRPATAPRWKYGRLDHELHFVGEHTGAFRTALAHLHVALWKMEPPSEDQLATARERFGPQPETPEAEQHTGPSPAMARCAAVLRYYEPLLRRHKLSGKDVVAYIDRPGVGYSYDPGNPLLDLVHEIGKVGDRVGGSFRRSYHEWVHYQVGERRQRQSDQLNFLSLDLITLHGGDTEPLLTVDLEAILAAPPGTVIELEPEAEIEAAEAAAARIRIIHDAEGTEVRNTPRGGDQRIREALNDLGFWWSRKQQKWYQPRDTPFEDREAAVQGLRAAFGEIGVPYTYEGPAPEAEPEEISGSPEQTPTESPAATAAAEPDQPAADEPAPPQEEPDDVPPAADTAEGADPADQLDLFGAESGMEASEGEPSGGDGETGQDAPPPAPEPEAETGTDEPETATEDEESEEEQTEAPAEGTDEVAVQTPHGPGIVIGSDDNGLVLVTTAAGTRVYEDEEIQWPDDIAKPEGNPERAAKARQNEADAAQAATSEGIELKWTDGTRLVDLDLEAGHGTIVDTDDTVVGWVRARIGDDGRRYWWGQDARGGVPTGPFHEKLPVTAGVPAIRAAERVRTTQPIARESQIGVPIPPETAAREVRLTTAQVRELSELSITGTYSDGSPIEPPEWVSSHRRYVLTVAQMQALGEAAQTAADALTGATAKERRAIRVLRNAVERFDFEAYDTARSMASLPPIGEVDPYARPYQRPDHSETAPQEETGPTEQETAAEQTAAADVDQTATAETSDAPQDPAPAADTPAEEETQPQETTAAEPEPGAAGQNDPAPQSDPAPDTAAAAEPDPESAPTDDGQLGLFPEETPDPGPTTRRRGRSRSRRGEGEPAAPPGTEGAPDRGRLGVYGHAGHGDCDRCGSTTDRYTVVWDWYSSEETLGAMAAECAPCVELTVGVSASQAAHLADVAEARRGGRRIEPRRYEPRNDVVSYRTAENEWTAVHLPTGKRYRTGKESENGYRGFVTRDLYGVAQGTSVGIPADAVVERAALGRTAETHPTDSDDWVYFSYRQDAKKIALHEGESLTARSDGLRRNRAPLRHGPLWHLTIGDVPFVVEVVYQQGQPGEDGHRLDVTASDRSQARYEYWDGVLEWAREHAREAAVPPAAPVLAAAVQAETDAEEPEPTEDRGEMVVPQETADPGVPVQPGEEPAQTETAEAVPDADETVEEAVEIEEPPEPQSYTDVVPLPADQAYELHLTGMDGQAPDRGELRYAQATVATVQRSAGGQWFARLAADGLPADATNLAGSPQEAADRGAILFSALTGTPYGAPPTPAVDEGVRTRADVLRGELRDAAQWHRGALTYAAARVRPMDYLTQPQYRAMTTALDGVAAAVSGQHNSRQMAAQLEAVAQEATAWRNALSDDVGSFERELLAYPLAHLVHTVSRLQTRLEVTLEAARAERAAAEQAAAETASPAPAPEMEQAPAPPAAEDTPVAEPAPAPAAQEERPEQPSAPREQDTPTPGPSEAGPAVSAEPVSADSVQQTPPVATPERVRGPMVRLGLREASEGQLVAEVHTEEASTALVLPGITVADLPGQALPVTVDVPMLRRPAQQAEQLVSDEETEEWLAGFLSDGPLAAAWSNDAVRVTLVTEVRDTLREGMAPSLDDVTDWLVTTSAEHEGLLLAAHTTDLEAFTAEFERAADSLVTSGGSEHLLWTYLGDEGTRRTQVLAAATPRAYEQLRALPAPADASAPERAAADQTESPVPASTPEGNEMATPDEGSAPETIAAAAETPEPEAASGTVTQTDEAPVLDRPDFLPQPGSDDVSTDIAVEGARRALAEAGFGGGQQPERAPDETAPETAAEEFGDGESDWASVYAWTEEDERELTEGEEPQTAADAPQAGELPLWTGPEASMEDAAPETTDGPLDVMAAFEGVQEAWTEHVPDEQGTAADLYDDLRDELATLQRLLADAVGSATPDPEPAPSPAPEPSPTSVATDQAPAHTEAEPAPAAPAGDQTPEQETEASGPQQQADAVNAALRGADTHAETLKDLPEWQELQTLRGAWTNLRRLLKERAGEHFERLTNDNRVGDFLRKISLKTCEKIAELAQKGADKLRRPDERDSEASRDLPSADALLRLGDAALSYSSPRPGPGGHTPATPTEPSGREVDVPAMHKMGEALKRPLPTAGKGSRGVSTAAARGRSTTTRRRPKAAADTAEQAGHLRRGATDQQQARKSNQK